MAKQKAIDKAKEHMDKASAKYREALTKYYKVFDELDKIGADYVEAYFNYHHLLNKKKR